MIIVGAGIIGLSCAWRLARAGRPVRVFDSGALAGEASWAGAGMLAPGGELEHDSPLTQMSLASLALYPEFVRELEEASGESIDFRRCGAVEVAFCADESEKLARRATQQAEAGISSEAVDWPDSDTARLYPADALVDPRAVTSALVKACGRLGVLFHDREAVLHVAPDGSSVRSAKREYTDTGILVAAGAWSSSLVAGLRAARPVRGHLISWQCPPGTLHCILRHGPTYLVQRSDGTLIAGSSTEEAGFDRTIDPVIVEDIHRRAVRLLPVLTGEPIAECWNGLRPAIEGDEPAIGRVAGTRIWTAFGHYRNGILLAPETARIIAESVSEAS